MRWPSAGPYNDAELRLLCYLDWVLFRKRFTFDEYPNLTAFLAGARAYQPFTQTIPHG
jgi:glutathione S-transferase